MNEWMNHPAMKNMDPIKVELIKNAARQTQGKKGTMLAPVMMTLVTSANQQGIRFTQEEMTLILEILKEGKTPAEKQKIDQMVQMVQMMQKNGEKKGRT